VSIRNIRRHAKDSLDKMVKNSEVGEDDARRAERELQELTDTYVAKIDELLKHKKPSCSKSERSPRRPQPTQRELRKRSTRPAHGPAHRPAFDLASADAWYPPTPPRPPRSRRPPHQHRRNLPAAIAVGAILGGLALVTLLTVKATF